MDTTTLIIVIALLLGVIIGLLGALWAVVAILRAFGGHNTHTHL